MDPSEVLRAVKAGTAVASALGLRVDGADVVHNSNRIVVRLIPCDVLARVAPPAHHSGAQFEVEVARRLAETSSPVAELESRVEPRVYVHGGFAVTLWTYYEPVASSGIAPPDYANALARLHAGLYQIDLGAPHFTDRVAEALRVVTDREQSPELLEPDRELLSNTLSGLGAAISARGGGDQLLHGEPHPGNLLNTMRGPLFVDLETCCLGPVEFDIAHAPEEVGEHYPAADQDVLDLCRILMRAMVTAWRWDREDQFPNRLRWGIEGLNQLRAALDAKG
ncbi:MAG: aminoglycoside phosphotransferase family protein [Chloroflexi bacterium]|nr:MAG: aminoglycoside phosphotransferase family protein [Chloroflexota bacterium]